MSLQRQVFTASVWTLMGSAGQQTIAFAIFLYLTRVLDPVDFGVMAIATFFLDILLNVSRFGQVETLQQMKMGSEENRSTSFWLLQGIGLASAILLVVLAAPVAALYGLPKLQYIMLLIAPCCVIQSVATVQEAGLRSSFGFRALAMRTFAGSLLGGVAAVIAAATGYGVYALALQRLVQVSTISATVLISYRWLPRLAFVGADARRLLTSGLHVMSATLMTMLVPRTVDLLVGYFLGARDLGLMRIAFRVFDFINQFAVTPLINVALSSFTQLQEDPEGLRNAYLRMTQLSALVLLPAFVGLALVATDVVPLMLGSKWMAVCVPMAILSVMSLAAPINYFFAPALIAIGHSREVMKQSVLQLVIGISFALVAVQFSLAAVLAAHVTRAYLVSLYNLVALKRLAGLPYARVARKLLPLLFAALVMAGGVWTLRHYLLLDLPSLLRLAASIAAGGLLYVGTIVAGDLVGVWRGYLADLRTVALKTLRRGGAAPTAAA